VSVNDSRKRQATEDGRPYMPEDDPMPDEIAAIERSRTSVAEFGTIDFDDMDWD